MADARKSSFQRNPCGIIRITALCDLCRYRHKCHWTGHPARLARSFGKRFGDQAYAFEELVAELTAALVGADVGLPTTHLDDHAAYIGSWLAILRKDNRALLTAAARAEEAAGFLLRATDLACEDDLDEQAAA
ncbi:zincin-like metallopeptidase domain-containing protein [Sphingobium baderi]|uniref:zincin-like metallopeptidase domain-containing protein n=1 Tax=Sphingobium baderi TaxID=1332080 RepID=UPI001E60E3F9|nr:zincin-like metallopeptidase domain-containing protein [Sphingobium baderi]